MAQLSTLCECILPTGPDGPGADEAHVVEYIVGQLAGAWGNGARMYRQGPFVENADPELGWQSPMTPLETYRYGLAALELYTRCRYATGLAALTPAQIISVVDEWSSGRVDTFGSLDPVVFFRMVRQNVAEGLFADPAYGGNHEMIGWRWLGYPGVAAAHGGDYARNIDNYGSKYEVEPRSLQRKPHS